MSQSKMEIAKAFNKDISAVISILDSYFRRDSSIDRVKRLISIAKRETPLEIINKSMGTLWKMRDRIISMDDDYFVNGDFSEWIGDDDYDLVESIIDKLQKIHSSITPAERQIIWAHMKRLLELSIDYRIAIGYHIN